MVDLGPEDPQTKMREITIFPMIKDIVSEDHVKTLVRYASGEITDESVEERDMNNSEIEDTAND